MTQPEQHKAPLGAAEVNRLIIDAVQGKQRPSVPGETAARLYPQIKKEVEEIMRTGLIVGLLSE